MNIVKGRSTISAHTNPPINFQITTSRSRSHHLARLQHGTYSSTQDCTVLYKDTVPIVQYCTFNVLYCTFHYSIQCCTALYGIHFRPSSDPSVRPPLTPRTKVKRVLSHRIHGSLDCFVEGTEHLHNKTCFLTFSMLPCIAHAWRKRTGFEKWIVVCGIPCR